MTDQVPPNRQPILNAPSVVVNAIIALALVHVARLAMPVDSERSLLAWGAFIPARYGRAADGVLYSFPGAPLTDLTSIFTYGLLHGDALHLIMNSIWLLAFGTPVARRLPALRFLLFCFVCSVAGALFYLLLNQGSLIPMIGASAGISGLMGAVGRIITAPVVLGQVDGRPAVYRQRLAGLGDRRLLVFAGIWIGFSILVGATDISFGGAAARSIAWEAHLGGFFAGLLLFGAFERPNWPTRKGKNG
ncbi:MAG: rhomboid family intramembrane serine protease [Alphaproteobacteria bacterium]